jgi:hypothetical protein
MPEIKRFSDIPSEGLFPETEKVYIKDILGKEIVVYDAKFIEGRFGEFVVIKFRFPKERKFYSVSCGGQVVVKKVKKAVDEKLLPLRGKIIREKRYYEII